MCHFYEITKQSFNDADRIFFTMLYIFYIYELLVYACEHMDVTALRVEGKRYFEKTQERNKQKI